MKRPIFRYLTLVFLVPLVSLIGLNFQSPPPAFPWDESTPLSVVLRALGEPAPKHYIEQPDQALIQKGKALVTEGTAPGSSYISLHYVCTSCHNLVQEDPDLQDLSPEKRLAYAQERGIPFLQGTTFKGIVTRQTWYNGDYVEKYGDLVTKANQDLGESIQLCAQECSQGRKLNQEELQAIIAYLWQLEYTLGELKLPNEVWELLRANHDQPEKHARTLAMLKQYYPLLSPATFADVPERFDQGYGLKGDPQKGKAVYELGCQQCHKLYGVSDFILDNTRMSFRLLKRNLNKSSVYNLYEIIRKGTYPQLGHDPYMPLYPLERMSHQQVEDLRAYIEQRAEGKPMMP